MKKTVFIFAFFITIFSYNYLLNAVQMTNEAVTILSICRSKFGGTYAAVRIWKNEKEDRLYELEGDSSKMVDAPTIFYDKNGNEKLLVSGKPLDPSNKKYRLIEKQKKELLKGYQFEKKVTCFQADPKENKEK